MCDGFGEATDGVVEKGEVGVWVRGEHREGEIMQRERGVEGEEERGESWIVVDVATEDLNMDLLDRGDGKG